MDNPRWPNKGDFSILWFDENDITDLKFIYSGWSSEEVAFLDSLIVQFNITGAEEHYSSFSIHLYDLDNPVKVDKEFWYSPPEYFSPNEFDARYKEALTYIQNLEKVANQN